MSLDKLQSLNYLFGASRVAWDILPADLLGGYSERLTESSVVLLRMTRYVNKG